MSFIICSQHMPKEVGGIYAVITTTVTKSEGKILQENRYLCFARYLGEHKWQLYDEIDLELNRLDETAEDVIPQEGIMVPIPDLFGKAGSDSVLFIGNTRGNQKIGINTTFQNAVEWNSE